MAFTFFFRDLDSLERAADALVANALGRSRIRVWDAGCATGQEPYTLAILLAERLGHFAFRNVEIHATDYDAPLLDVVRRATYSRAEAQRVPGTLYDKYWDPVDDASARLSEPIRNALRVQSHDLLSLRPIRTGFSLVVCKNVLLHFQPAERVAVLKMFHDALEPDGLLIMEHTQKMPAEAGPWFEQMARVDQLYRRVGS